MTHERIFFNPRGVLERFVVKHRDVLGELARDPGRSRADVASNVLVQSCRDGLIGGLGGYLRYMTPSCAGN